MPTEKEVLEGVLVKALNFTTEEVAALYEAEVPKEDALQVVLDKRATVVQAEKAKAKKDREEQLMRGRKEGAQKVEKVLRDEGVIDGDLTAESEDFPTKVKEAIAGFKTPQVQAETDEARIKASEIFRKREKELLGIISSKDAEHEAKWSARDAKEARERTLSVVKEKALAQFKAKNPILPKDETKAKNQLRLLEQELEALDYELSEDGKEVEFIKDKEGKRIETRLGAPKKFAQLVDELGDQYFEFNASAAKSSAGDVTKGSQPSKGLAGKKPADQKEYDTELDRIMREVEDPKERATQTKALREAWTAG